MKLGIEHLAPYLPYGLKIQGQTHLEVQELSGLRNENVYTVEGDPLYGWASLFEVKPILRPLSDLTKEIEHNGERFVPIELLKKIGGDHNWSGFNYNQQMEFITKGINIRHAKYWIIEKLFEWHFDVSGLIDKGLAIKKD